MSKFKKFSLRQLHFKINGTEETMEIDSDCCNCVFRYSKQDIEQLKNFLNDFLDGGSKREIERRNPC